MQECPHHFILGETHLDVFFQEGPEAFEGGADFGLGGGEFVFGEALVGGGDLTGEHVVFDLGLGAAGAHGEAAAIGEINEEHLLGGDGFAFFIDNARLAEVAHVDDGAAINFGRWVGSVAVGEFGDLGGSAGAFENFALVHFEEVTDIAIHLVEQSGDSEALAGGVGGELGEHDDGSIAIFVTAEVIAHVAIAFLTAEDEELAVLEAGGAGLGGGQVAIGGEDVGGQRGFVFGEFIADPLEAGEGVDAKYAKFGGDGVLHGASDEGLEEDSVLFVFVIEDAEIKHRLQAIPAHEGAGLIAREEDHFALVIADADAHAVAIRIGADDDVSAFFVGEIDGHFQGRGVLGVRGFDGGEAAITHVLLGDGEVVEAELFQQDRDEHATGAVEGGEDDFEVFGLLAFQQLGLKHHGLDSCEVEVVHLSAERDDFALLIGGQGCVGFVFEGVDLFDDAGGVGLDDASAVAEVHFEAVVVGGVVTGGEHDAGVGAELTDSEGHLRRGAAAVEEINVSAVFDGDLGAFLSELGGKMAGVVSENDAGFATEAGFGPVGLGIRDEATGGAADVIVVHGVRADAGVVGALVGGGRTTLGGGDDLADGASAQAAGAELESLIEAVIQLRPLTGGGEFLDTGAVNRIRAGGEQGQDVFVAGGEELTGVSGGFESGFEGHEDAENSWA